MLLFLSSDLSLKVANRIEQSSKNGKPDVGGRMAFERPFRLKPHAQVAGMFPEAADQFTSPVIDLAGRQEPAVVA